MACTLCQLDIEGTLCEVCRYLSEDHVMELPAACDHCGAPIANTQNLCRVCTAMLQAVRNNPWLVRAQVAWEQENIILARRKRKLLGKGGPSGF